MSDERRHRGPHPQDVGLFASERLGALRAAVADLAWLLSRGYASPSAQKIVGDRYGLDARQRTAVMRSTCTDAAREDRRAREVGMGELRGRRVMIDGYNVLTTVEAAMAGGVVIVGRDGAWRDLASMHGTWRRVEETGPAIERVARAVDAAGVAEVVWYLDAPVSNSGRLCAMIRAVRDWRVELVPDPDKVIGVTGDAVVASADSVVLDRCGAWANLAREALRGVEGVWLVEMT
jgi:hypothetical protein